MPQVERCSCVSVSECFGQNIAALLHRYEAIGVEEINRLASSKVERASREASPRHDNAKVHSGVMNHAVKITNNARTNTVDVRFALHYSSQSVASHFYVDAAIR